MEIEHIKGELEVSKHATPDYAPQYGIYIEGERNCFCTVRDEDAKVNAEFLANAPQTRKQRNALFIALKAFLSASPDNVDHWLRATKDAERAIDLCKRSNLEIPVE